MEVHISRYLLLVYVDGQNYVCLFCFFNSTYFFYNDCMCQSEEKKLFLRFHLAELSTETKEHIWLKTCYYLQW